VLVALDEGDAQLVHPPLSRRRRRAASVQVTDSVLALAHEAEARTQREDGTWLEVRRHWNEHRRREGAWSAAGGYL